MNTGIITFYNHSNYGAVLQAYALQTTLEDLGHEAFHVDFCDDIEPTISITNNFIKQIETNKKIRDKHFSDFRNKFLKTKEINELINRDDIHYFVGSDQVWNPEITNGDERYFCTFADTLHKHTYGCSLGKIIGTKWEDIYSSNIKKFKDISVREQSGVETIKKLTDRKAEVVLDPTLLLKSDQWETFVSQKNNTSEKYLLYISVDNNIEQYKHWKQFAQDNNLKFKTITASFFPPAGFEPWSGVSVCDWISYVYHADVVVTESFHGLVFSILFHKNFIVERLDNALKGRNNRLVELLNKLKLTSTDQANNETDLIIDTLKNKSIEYIKNSLIM